MEIWVETRSAKLFENGCIWRVQPLKNGTTETYSSVFCVFQTHKQPLWTFFFPLIFHFSIFKMSLQFSLFAPLLFVLSSPNSLLPFFIVRLDLLISNYKPLVFYISNSLFIVLYANSYKLWIIVEERRN